MTTMTTNIMEKTIQQKQNQQRYQRDVQMMSTKRRFGYFSMLPSHTAGITDYSQKSAQKDESGRVRIGTKGVYSGVRSDKVLNKTYFSNYVSPFVGCPYQDPGRRERQKALQAKMKQADKEIFKPARLQKTLYVFYYLSASSSYEYICKKPEDKQRKFRDQNGRVVTESPNVCSSPLTKLVYKRQRDFKYSEDPYQAKKIKRKQQLDADLAKRGQPFKGGNPVKDFFNNNKVLFDDTTNFRTKSADKSQSDPSTMKKSRYAFTRVTHEAPFRPSSGKLTKNGGMFNKLTYTQGCQPKKRPQSGGLPRNNEVFRLMNKVQQSKPCPSVTLNKVNLMRKCR